MIYRKWLSSPSFLTFPKYNISFFNCHRLRLFLLLSIKLLKSSIFYAINSWAFQISRRWLNPIASRILSSIIQPFMRPGVTSQWATMSQQALLMRKRANTWWINWIMKRTSSNSISMRHIHCSADCQPSETTLDPFTFRFQSSCPCIAANQSCSDVCCNSKPHNPLNECSALKVGR